MNRRLSASSDNSDACSSILADDAASLSLPSLDDRRTSFQSDYSTNSARNHWSASSEKTAVPFDWRKADEKKGYTKGPEVGLFDRHAIPSAVQLQQAAITQLTDENGSTVSFRDIISGSTTIVIFIRHSFCGFCQEFLRSIAEIDQEPLRARKIRLVGITLSDWKNIRPYRKITHCPFPIYTNPERTLYEALGMSLTAMTFAAEGPSQDASMATQIIHTGKGLWRGILRFKIGSQGAMDQLGGEFIFENRPAGQPMSCAWASRMTTTRDHVHPKVLCQRAIRFGPDPVVKTKEELAEENRMEMLDLQTPTEASYQIAGLPAQAKQQEALQVG